MVPPPKGIGLSVGMWEVVESGMNGGQFIRLRKAYISNLSLLLSLESFKKFVVVVVGGGGG